MLFVSLDVDNTLLHTLTLQNISITRRDDIVSRLSELYPGASLIQEPVQAVIVPRPGLTEFQAFLKSNSHQISFGIYSSANDAYIRQVLGLVSPWLLQESKFIWDSRRCIDGKFKSLEQVADTQKVSLTRIFAIDDLPCISPKENRISINAFEIKSLVDKQFDTELNRIAKYLIQLLPLRSD